jgi:hypothetical protein
MGGADVSSSKSTRQYRACSADAGDGLADVGPWTESVSEAADLAHRWTTEPDPPYDEIYIERRDVSAPERHITVRHPRRTQ